MGFFAKPYGAGFLFIRSGFLVVPRARKMFLITSVGLLDSLPGLAWKGDEVPMEEMEGSGDNRKIVHRNASIDQR